MSVASDLLRLSVAVWVSGGMAVAAGVVGRVLSVVGIGVVVGDVVLEWLSW